MRRYCCVGHRHSRTEIPAVDRFGTADRMQVLPRLGPPVARAGPHTGEIQPV